MTRNPSKAGPLRVLNEPHFNYFGCATRNGLPPFSFTYIYNFLLNNEPIVM